MEYFINPTVFSSTFALPSDVADKYLKLAKGDHIKVLIYIMRNAANLNDVEKISKETDVCEYDVKEALLFWADAGIIVPQNKSCEKSQKPKTVKKMVKPQREDVAKRGLEDPKIHYLLNETQLKFGRNLKTNETSTLVWLYDDQGLDVSLILLIVQYAVTHEKPNIRFIESVAVDWINKGIDNLTDADEELRKLALSETAWNTVRSAFGIDRRKPGKKESGFCNKWVIEWEYSKEMLEVAYDICVDKNSEISFDYINGIIERWHKDGIKTLKDLENDQKPKKDSKSAYNLDLFEKMLNSED